MLTRRLALRRETLAPLTGDDLRNVGGAADDSALSCVTCLELRCYVVIGIDDPSLAGVTDCCMSVLTCHRAVC